MTSGGDADVPLPLLDIASAEEDGGMVVYTVEDRGRQLPDEWHCCVEFTPLDDLLHASSLFPCAVLSCSTFSLLHVERCSALCCEPNDVTLTLQSSLPTFIPLGFTKKYKSL